MLGDSNNINNLCCNPVALKKKVYKTSKKIILGSCLHYNGVNMGHAQNEKQFFFDRNNKNKSAFRNFSFYQNIICFG